MELNKMSKVHTIVSSFLESFEYDEDTQLLKVTFRNGKEYEYADVPQDVIDRWLDANSQGAFYTANIKDKFQAPE